MSPSSRPLSVVLAGGGTAGHIEPALAVADAVAALGHRRDRDIRVTALGTERGLETTLIPDRGVDLELIPPVPVPRAVNKDLFTLPVRLIGALRRTRKTLRSLQADVVVGFGGYVSAPAYLAARSLGLPIVVHEANARAGMSNKLGVRLGGRALAASQDSGLDAEVVGIPVRGSLLSLDRRALRDDAREFFGLDPDAPVLLVTGGSQGAASINTAVGGAARTLADAGIGVLHAYGRKNTAPVVPDTAGAPPYVAVPYIDRMDLALAAADLVLCRSGAMTVAEISACGLPAVYVPLPHGNGEQELNARPVVAAGGGSIVKDKDLDAGRVAREVIPLLRDPGSLERAAQAAAAAGHRDAAERIAEIVVSEAESRK